MPQNESVWILLRKTAFQESSLIVSGISADFGRIDFLFKGAKTLGKRRFPEAELFREFQVIFREAKNADGLAGIKAWEPTAFHDEIANRTEHYLALCRLSAFFLKHTKPMLPVPKSFLAFRALLTRLEREKDPEPWISLTKFVLLHENGFVPESRRADRLIELALDPQKKIPEGYSDFWKRFRTWVDNLNTWNGL